MINLKYYIEHQQPDRFDFVEAASSIGSYWYLLHVRLSSPPSRRLIRDEVVEDEYNRFLALFFTLFKLEAAGVASGSLEVASEAAMEQLVMVAPACIGLCTNGMSSIHSIEHNCLTFFCFVFFIIQQQQ